MFVRLPTIKASENTLSKSVVMCYLRAPNCIPKMQKQKVIATLFTLSWNNTYNRRTLHLYQFLVPHMSSAWCMKPAQLAADHQSVWPFRGKIPGALGEQNRDNHTDSHTRLTHALHTVCIM